MGPEGGESGGEIVAEGPPEKVSTEKLSYTGQFLKDILNINQNERLHKSIEYGIKTMISLLQSLSKTVHLSLFLALLLFFRTVFWWRWICF